MKGFKSTILSVRSGRGGGGGGGALPPYMTFTGMCRWSGMGTDLSVLNRPRYIILCNSLLIINKVLPARLI